MKISEKKEKQKSRPFKWPQWETKTPRPSIDNHSCKQQELIWTKLEKWIQIKTVGNLQDRNQEVKSSHFQILCSLCWSWHGQWRWQCYHVHAKVQSPVTTNKSTKYDGTFENMGFKGKTVWRFQKKKEKQKSRPFKWPQWETKTPRPSIDNHSCKQQELIWKKLEKWIQIKTVGNLQDRNQEVKSSHFQILCSLCWSWHGHWRWQCYHVHAKVQSPVTTNKSTKYDGTFENMGFKGKKVWRFQKKKRNKNLDLSNNPSGKPRP